MKSIRVSVVILFGLLALSSCDIFSTRTPNPPSSGNSYIWTPATSIQTLLDDFKGALQVVDAANSVKAFVDQTDSVPSGLPKSYTFVPQAGADKTPFIGWSVQSEQSYITKLSSLLPASQKITVLFTNVVINQSNTTSGTVTLNYNLILPVSQTSGIPGTVSGNLQFQVELVTTAQSIQEWRIAQWNDYADPTGSNPTWTNLKADLI